MIDDGWDDLPAPDETIAADIQGIGHFEVAPNGDTFFTDEETHKAWAEWGGMPEFVQEDLQPWATLVVKFQTPEDRQRFAELIGQPIRGSEPRGIWFPKIDIGHYWDKRYRDASFDSLMERVVADAVKGTTE